MNTYTDTEQVHNHAANIANLAAELLLELDALTDLGPEAIEDAANDRWQGRGVSASLLAAKDALLELREDGSTAEMIIIAASLAV